MRNERESQAVFNPLPAVVIGGPPHSGKSVLAYGLTRVLREWGVDHYLLRAYPPDYEGDWFQEGEQELVRHLRLKGKRSEAWLPLIRRDIAHRHLPLIVDVGGLPTPEQEAILGECTHAVLLTPDEHSRQEWLARFARHGLVLLADLRSDLNGQDRLEAGAPLLQGVLAGLERGRRAGGPVLAALATRLADLFVAESGDLRRRHLESAPVELVVDVERLARQVGRDPTRWRPADLRAVLDYLPSGEPLALYGRGPNWLYAAVAVHTLFAPFFLFDVRLGWIEAPLVRVGAPLPAGPLTVQVHPLPGAHWLTFQLPTAYLDVVEASDIRIPSCPMGGAILSGKLPLWLWAALARASDAPWVAVLQPQLPGAVVVRDPSGEREVGAVLPVPAA